MWVLISSDTCATDTPSTAGAMRCSTWRTPGWCQAARSRPGSSPIRGRQPIRASAGTCTASCSTPPTITPAASARIGSRPHAANRGAPHQAAPIIATFSSTGVAAGSAKRRQVFRMPADSATSDMNRMYGNIQRVIVAASSNSARPEPTSHTSSGAPTTPATQVASSVQPSTVATASTSLRVAASPSRARTSARIGTKACENAPSANSRRSRFGMRKATLNASVAALAPKAAAISCSRTSPVMRDARVRIETVEAAFSRFIAPFALQAGNESARL